MKSIVCKGQIIDMDRPKIMGILNITPDSFYDGGSYKNESAIIAQTRKMLTEGATFIDIGAYSSRPGAAFVSETEELKRIAPVVSLLVETFPDILISIDTFRASVAEACVSKGASVINDISAGNMDNTMIETVASLQVPYIMMHMQGTPQTMQKEPSYTNCVKEVFAFFSEKLEHFYSKKGIDAILDVGFGFGKTIAHNYELLNHLSFFQELGCPILTGISRKSMLYKPLEISPKEALNATTFAHVIALQQGTNIFRVHDVKEAKEAITLHELVSSHSK